MRLATITNWAYGTTVALTLISGTAMLFAADAQRQERAAVDLRHGLTKQTSVLGREIYTLTGHARQFLDTGDPTYALLYRRDLENLVSAEQRVAHMEDTGASPSELHSLAAAVKWADTLHDEQEAAIAAFERGDEKVARQILFGPEYQRQLDRAEAEVIRFQDQLEARAERDVSDAALLARIWRTIAEVMLTITALLFLAVLYFVFKRRVLKPVSKLSEVVSRMARHDYELEPPQIEQIDEIGDIAEAIGLFREATLERQALEAERDADRAVRDVLACMTQRMQACDVLDELGEVVQRFVPQITPGYAGRLYVLDTSCNVVTEICNWAEPQHSVPEFAPSDCWAMRRGLPHLPDTKHLDVPCLHLGAETTPVSPTICLPLTAQRETLGLLYLEIHEAELKLGETILAYLSMLAENVGLALANIKLREALHDLAMRDALTGIANRRSPELALARQSALAQQRKQPLSAMMIDIDHFKRFNDEFGHDAGDAVLRGVGDTLSKATRGEDLCFRYGGEEFLVLMIGIGARQGSIRAEQVRSAIANLRIRHEGRDLGPITASIGIASTPEHCPPDELMQTADASLLRAKAEGRDRISVAEKRECTSPERRAAAQG